MIHRPRRRPGRLAVLVLILATAAAGTIAGCRDAADDAPLHLVVISIDTLRADALIGDSPRRATTPHFDDLAAASTAFTNCWSHVPQTLPAHAALMTGRLPAELELHDNTPFPLRGDVPTLASWLADAGFATAAVVGGQPLARGSGFERGFERYDDPPSVGSGSSHFSELDARAVTDRAIAQWQRPVGDRRRFHFVHYYDPHQPYSPPRDCMPTSTAEGDRSGDADRYRGEVTHVDREFGRLLAALREGNERCLLLITSDHGEGLGDLGERTHGFQLLPATLRVPLLIVEIEGLATRAPAPLAATPRERLIGHVDLLPTLLELLAVDRPDGLGGMALQRSDGRHPARFVESLAGALQFGCAQQYGVRGEGALYLRGGGDAPTSLEGARFRVIGDSDERLLLDPGRAEPTAEELSAWRAAFADGFTRRLPFATDAATPRDLRPLGYLEASSDRARHALAAPAENALKRSALARRELIDRFLEAVACVDAGNPLPAIATLDQILTADPQFHAARFFRARARMSFEERDPSLRGSAARLAASDLAILLEEVAGYPGAALLRAKALGLAGEFEAALATLDEFERTASTAAEALWLRGSLLLDRQRAGRIHQRYDPQLGFGCLLDALERAPQRGDWARDLERALNALARAPDAPPWVATASDRLRRLRQRRHRRYRPQVARIVDARSGLNASKAQRCWRRLHRQPVRTANAVLLSPCKCTS
ncbi:MAG: hypothetical protein EXS13_02485 [Planctomycetes bacterium]|nr:hypothetical protein [Planctomycetota bacterium]